MEVSEEEWARRHETRRVEITDVERCLTFDAQVKIEKADIMKRDKKKQVEEQNHLICQPKIRNSRHYWKTTISSSISGIGNEKLDFVWL